MTTISERITNLREERFMTKRELADRLGISESQLSRIESGKTATVSSDILTGLAKCFDVSADYILGLSPLRDNAHILTELRLSEAACEKLIRREIDGDTLSRLMEHGDFKLLTRNAKAYFEDTFAEGVSARNEILAFGASFVRDHAEETGEPPALRAEANQMLKARTRPHEIELAELRELTMRILRETKEQIDTERQKGDPAAKRKLAGKEFSARLREIAEEVYASQGSEEEKLDLLTDRVLQSVGEQTGMQGWAQKLLKPVYKRILRNAGAASGAAGESETPGAASEKETPL